MMGMMMLMLITIVKKYLFGAKDTETGCLKIDHGDGRFLSTIEWQWFLSKKPLWSMVLFTSEPLLSMVDGQPLVIIVFQWFFHMSTIGINGLPMIF